MKQCVKKKMYDTETARLVYEIETDGGGVEKLLHKRTGEYFLFAKRPDNDYRCYAEYGRWMQLNRGANGKIFPLTKEQAEKLMIDNGYKEPPQTTSIVSLCIDVNTLKRMRDNAAKRGVTVEEYLKQIFEMFEK